MVGTLMYFTSLTTELSLNPYCVYSGMFQFGAPKQTTPKGPDSYMALLYTLVSFPIKLVRNTKWFYLWYSGL